jgi:hypothetical protein
MASFSNTINPTPFGAFDSDTHFQEDASSIVTYVKRRLGDDILTVELTNKQIWANFEEATFEFSKQMNAHQAESYMSNILGLSVGQIVSNKKNTFGHYYFLKDGQSDLDVINGVLVIDTQPLLIQTQDDPRFMSLNKEARYDIVNDKREINITVKTNDNLNTGTILYFNEAGAEVAANVEGALPLKIETPAFPIEDQKLGPHGQEQKFPRETVDYLIRRAEPYASEAGVGGVTDSVRGFIELSHDKQDYNVYTDMIIPGPDGEKLKLEEYNGKDDQLSLFNPIFKDKILSIASPTKIKIQEIFHFSPQAAYRFFDTTSAVNYLNNQFSFESFTPETVFYVLPVFEDLLRASQLDISNRVRRSNYSYKLQGQNLRIYPKPSNSNPMNLFVKFTFPSDPYKPSLPYEDASIEGVSNISNIPFGNIKYSLINQMSRQWIRQYTFALCKETLGLVRSKFSSVPIPGSELQMNGADLISQGREDKNRLLDGLKETTEKLTYQKLLEADSAQADAMTNILKKIPIPNGRAIIIG